MKEIWAVFNPSNQLFDCIILRGWWVYRQQLYMNPETNELTWLDVPMFAKRAKRRGSSP